MLLVVCSRAIRSSPSDSDRITLAIAASLALSSEPHTPRPPAAGEEAEKIADLFRRGPGQIRQDGQTPVLTNTGGRGEHGPSQLCGEGQERPLRTLPRGQPGRPRPRRLSGFGRPDPEADCITHHRSPRGPPTRVKSRRSCYDGAAAHAHARGQGRRPRQIRGNPVRLGIGVGMLGRCGVIYNPAAAMETVAVGIASARLPCAHSSPSDSDRITLAIAASLVCMVKDTPRVKSCRGESYTSGAFPGAAMESATYLHVHSNADASPGWPRGQEASLRNSFRMRSRICIHVSRRLD